MAKGLKKLLRGQSDGAASHSTRSPKNGNQAAGYAALHVGSSITSASRNCEPAPQLRCHSTPGLPYSVCLRRSLRYALHIDLLTTFFYRLKTGWRKCWSTLRQLSGDDAYEHYLAHHATCHAGTPPHSREAFFRQRQQHKWDGIKRCC